MLSHSSAPVRHLCTQLVSKILGPVVAPLVCGFVAGACVTVSASAGPMSGVGGPGQHPTRYCRTRGAAYNAEHRDSSATSPKHAKRTHQDTVNAQDARDADNASKHDQTLQRTHDHVAEWRETPVRTQPCTLTKHHLHQNAADSSQREQSSATCMTRPDWPLASLPEPKAAPNNHISQVSSSTMVSRDEPRMHRFNRGVLVAQTAPSINFRQDIMPQVAPGRRHRKIAGSSTLADTKLNEAAVRDVQGCARAKRHRQRHAQETAANRSPAIREHHLRRKQCQRRDCSHLSYRSRMLLCIQVCARGAQADAIAKRRSCAAKVSPFGQPHKRRLAYAARHRRGNHGNPNACALGFRHRSH